MITYWDVLTVLSAVEFVMAAVFFIQISKIGLKPVGIRLAIIAVVFLVQGVFSLLMYNYWRAAGYGSDVAAPLLIYHVLTLAGLAALLDIVRK